MWAFCGDRSKCKERFGECWLKRDKGLKPPPELPSGARKSEGWISGAVYENDTHVSGMTWYSTNMWCLGQQQLCDGALAAGLLLPLW
jgi:hypothetical protein